MAHQLQHLIGGEHLGLHVEFVLELAVIDAGVACRQDEHAAILGLEGQGLGDPGAFHAQGLGGQFHRCGGHGELLHPVLNSQRPEVGAAFFNRHDLLPLLFLLYLLEFYALK